MKELTRCCQKQLRADIMNCEVNYNDAVERARTHLSLSLIPDEDVKNLAEADPKSK